MPKFDFVEEKLADLKANSLLRRLNPVESVNGTIVQFCGNESEKVLFCSNDYLNIAGSDQVKTAVKQAVDKYGFGAGASRLICGTLDIHTEVEKAFSRFLDTEVALLFNSGWTANEAVLRTLPQSGDIVLMDKLDHASIIDAVKSSKAELRTFRRDNLSRCEKFLSDKRYRRKFIVTESVFSMDGDFADLKSLVGLKNTYDAILIVDEAHALGCFGSKGAGLIEQSGLSGQVDIIVAPLGKAFGAAGSVVASEKPVIDYLINKGRPFIYTTAPPPANCAAVLAALDVIKTQPQRRAKLAENAAYLRDRLSGAGFDISASCSQIVPVIIGDNAETMRISAELFDKGYFVSAIRPPTVENGRARLRISVQYEHTKDQIDGLLEALISSAKKS